MQELAESRELFFERALDDQGMSGVILAGQKPPVRPTPRVGGRVANGANPHNVGRAEAEMAGLAAWGKQPVSPMSPLPARRLRPSESASGLRDTWALRKLLVRLLAPGCPALPG